MIDKEKINHDPFPTNQKVFLIDDDTTEIGQISQHLVAPILKITSDEELVQAVTKRLTDHGNYLTLIIGSSLPKLIADNFGTIIKMINRLNSVEDDFRNSIMVIRIGQTEEEGAIENTIASFKDIDDFVDNVDLLSATSFERDEINVDEDTKRLIHRLQVSLGRTKATNEKLKEEQVKKDKLISQKNSELQTVKTEREIAQQQLEKARQIKAETEKERKATQDKIETLNRLIEEKISQNKKLETQIASLQTEKDGNDKIIAQQNAKINALSQEIEDLKNENAHLKLDNEDLVEQQSDLQSVAKYRKNNELLNDEINDLKDTNRSLESDLILKDHEIEQLKDRLERFRNGTDDEIKTGINSHLPIIELKQTDVIYFKILREPNYFRTMVDYLFNQLKAMMKLKKASVQMVVLKRDEGLDDKLYPKMKIVNDLGKLIEPNQISRLMVSRKMSGHVPAFENNNDLLIVLDYLDSNEIYVNTGGQLFNGVVTHSINEFYLSGLKGMSINLDSRKSLIDLTEIKDYHNATKQFKDNIFYNHLAKFFDTPVIQNIIKKYL